MNKRECDKCNEMVNEKNFYKVVSPNVCKECLIEEFLVVGLKELSDRHRFVYDERLFESIELKNECKTKAFTNYVRQISSLPQYKK